MVDSFYLELHGHSNSFLEVFVMNETQQFLVLAISVLLAASVAKEIRSGEWRKHMKGD